MRGMIFAGQIVNQDDDSNLTAPRRKARTASSRRTRTRRSISRCALCRTVKYSAGNRLLRGALAKAATVRLSSAHTCTPGCPVDPGSDTARVHDLRTARRSAAGDARPDSVEYGERQTFGIGRRHQHDRRNRRDQHRLLHAAGAVPSDMARHLAAAALSGSCSKSRRMADGALNHDPGRDLAFIAEHPQLALVLLREARSAAPARLSDP